MDNSNNCSVSNFNPISGILWSSSIIKKQDYTKDVNLPNFVGQTLEEAKVTLGKNQN